MHIISVEADNEAFINQEEMLKFHATQNMRFLEKQAQMEFEGGGGFKKHMNKTFTQRRKQSYLGGNLEKLHSTAMNSKHDKSEASGKQ